MPFHVTFHSDVQGRVNPTAITLSPAIIGSSDLAQLFQPRCSDAKQEAVPADTPTEPWTSPEGAAHGKTERTRHKNIQVNAFLKYSNACCIEHLGLSRVEASYREHQHKVSH
jgi:hypothetical protein